MKKSISEAARQTSAPITPTKTDFDAISGWRTKLRRAAGKRAKAAAI
jgi:hypothetical protein